MTAQSDRLFAMWEARCIELFGTGAEDTSIDYPVLANEVLREQYSVLKCETESHDV